MTYVIVLHMRPNLLFAYNVYQTISIFSYMCMVAACYMNNI